MKNKKICFSILLKLLLVSSVFINSKNVLGNELSDIANYDTGYEIGYSEGLQINENDKNDNLETPEYQSGKEDGAKDSTYDFGYYTGYYDKIDLTIQDNNNLDDSTLGANYLTGYKIGKEDKQNNKSDKLGPLKEYWDNYNSAYDKGKWDGYYDGMKDGENSDNHERNSDFTKTVKVNNYKTNTDYYNTYVDGYNTYYQHGYDFAQMKKMDSSLSIKPTESSILSNLSTYIYNTLYQTYQWIFSWL